MLIAVLLALALGLAIWNKSRRSLAAGKPYVFGIWDGGLLLRGEEWQAKHTIWIGQSLVALSLLAIIVPAGLAAREAQVKDSGGPCASVVTTDELRHAGIPVEKPLSRHYAEHYACSVAFFDGSSYALEMRRGPMNNVLRGEKGTPIASVDDAVLWPHGSLRHLIIERAGVTLDFTAPLEFPVASLESLARIAASRPKEFEPLASF